jgi:hypothetical protein
MVGKPTLFGIYPITQGIFSLLKEMLTSRNLDFELAFNPLSYCGFQSKFELAFYSSSMNYKDSKSSPKNKNYAEQTLKIISKFKFKFFQE